MQEMTKLQTIGVEIVGLQKQLVPLLRLRFREVTDHREVILCKQYAAQLEELVVAKSWDQVYDLSRQVTEALGD